VGWGGVGSECIEMCSTKVDHIKHLDSPILMGDGTQQQTVGTHFQRRDRACAHTQTHTDIASWNQSGEKQLREANRRVVFLFIVCYQVFSLSLPLFPLFYPLTNTRDIFTEPHLFQHVPMCALKTLANSIPVSFFFQNLTKPSLLAVM
jgi:hypothetical protein